MVSQIRRGLEQVPLTIVLILPLLLQGVAIAGLIAWLLFHDFPYLVSKRLILPTQWVVLGLGGLALTAAIASVVVTVCWIVRPLRQLIRMVQPLTDGDLNCQLQLTGPQEIQILAQSINQMARQLESSFGQLQASEARLSEILDNAMGSLVQLRLTTDNQWIYEYWSEGAEAVFGFTAAEFMANQQLWLSRIPQEDVDLAVLPSASYLQHASVDYKEYRFCDPDNRWRWIASTAKAQYDAKSQSWRVTIIDTDISQRKELELELQSSQAKLADILENTAACIVRYRIYADNHYRYEFWSAGAEAVFGYPAEAFMADPKLWIAHVDPQDIKHIIRYSYQRYFTEPSLYKEYRFRHQDGSIRWIASASTAWRDEADDCWVVTVIDSDISDRKQTEENLRRYERIVSTNADGIALLNRDLTYRLVNQTYLSRFGLSAAEVLGQSAEKILGKDSFERARPYLEACLAGKSVQYERWFDYATIGRQFISVTYAPYREVTGEVSGIVVSIRLLTDLKRAEAALRAERDLLNQVMNTSVAAIIVFNPQGQILFANNRAEEIMGLSQPEMLQRSYNDPAWGHADINGQPWPDEQRPFRQVMATGEPVVDVRLSILRPDGQRRLLSLNGAPVKDDQGQITNLVFTVNDITEQINAERALRESEARFRLLAENISDLVCLHDLDGTYQYVSQSCKAIMGYEPEELLGTSPYDLLHPDHRVLGHPASQSWAILHQTGPITYRMRCKSGHYIWLETLTKPILDHTGQPIQIQTTSRDVTEKVEMQSKLEHDALHDALTGLPNRSLLMERLELALERCHRHPDFHFAVLFLDLDRFKVINDSLGHQVGDALLIAFAQKLKALIRNLDVAARLSGDEFILLLEGIDSVQDAVHIAERILLELQTPFEVAGREIFINTSIGIATSGSQYYQGADLLRDADIAMYRAKANGKACYAIFDPAMHLKVLQEMQLENALRRALEHQQFVLYYQPILSLKTGRLKGFEVLIRWLHPQKGVILPGEFIALAEETGIIVPLGKWILAAACRQLKIWQQKFPVAASLSISVNLSTRQLQAEHLLEQLDAALENSQLPPSSLLLEITESILIENVGPVLDFLRAVQQRGIRLSIDDFGTGYSSLSYLHQFPFTYLKIDRVFIAPIGNSENNHGIVKSIVALSDSLGLDVIAEGIETSAQLTAMQQLGCEYGQGFLFDRPLTVKQVESLLAGSATYDLSTYLQD